MYRFDFTADAERDFDRLDQPIRKRILNASSGWAITRKMYDTNH